MAFVTVCAGHGILKGLHGDGAADAVSVAVLRAHGALHSLHFAAEKGLTDEVAAGIAAGLDINAQDDQVIFLCMCTQIHFRYPSLLRLYEGASKALLRLY